MTAAPSVNADTQTEHEQAQKQEEEFPKTPTNEDEHIWVDHVKGGVETFVDGTARWVDGFFGDQLNPDDYKGNTGRLMIAPQWSGYEGWTIDSSFRAKLKIPHAKDQFSAVIGRGDFDDFVSGKPEQRPSVMRRTAGDDEWLVGLGFDPYIDTQHDVSFGAGIRGGLRLDTYVRGRYRYETTLGANSELSVQSVGFWRDSDGFGVAQDLHHEVAFSQRWVSKIYAQATFAERTEGIRWNSNSRLYYLYDENRAIAGEIWIYGETHYAVPITDYGVRAVHRQRFLREWLFLEAWVGPHWPQEEPHEDRKLRWMAGVEFEMHFGQLN